MLETLRHDRRALHQIPELQFDLPKTQAYLFHALGGLGAEIEALSPSGILAFFDGGKPETAAFRADMDALPILETKTGGYASAHTGRMHACGHDGHMAILLTLARYVGEHIRELPRNVLLIFQPAEEGGGGARTILASGAFERRNVTQIFSLHVAPELAVGILASRPGAFFTKSSEVYAEVRGKSAHAANSEEGLDALSAGADFLLRAQAMEQVQQGYRIGAARDRHQHVLTGREQFAPPNGIRDPLDHRRLPPIACRGRTHRHEASSAAQAHTGGSSRVRPPM